MGTTLVILLIYFALLFAVAWYFSRRQDIEDYFANRRGTSLWLMTFSTVATVVGAGGTVGIVAEVYNTGISYGLALPAAYIFGMIILAITAKRIKEVGDKYKAYTVVDFFASRFDRKNELLTAILQIFLLVVWIGAQAVAIASLTSVLTKMEYHWALALTALITVLYTTMGGLKIDIITDFIQFWIIFIVFVVLAAMGNSLTGGVDGLFHSLRPSHLDPFAFGGVGWFLGIVLLSGFLFLGNTAHWQRIFSAQSPLVARRSFLLTIPFVIILSALILWIGLQSAVLVNITDKNQAIFAFMDKVLPAHWKGIGYAAILAVIMSSIDSYVVGGSAILFKIFYPTGRKANMLMARAITITFGLLGFLIAWLIPDIVKLSLLITYQALIFVPAIFAGLYSKGTSAEAAFYSILIPSVVLLILFWNMPKSVFLITTLLSVLIVLFWDKLKRRKIAKDFS